MKENGKMIYKMVMEQRNGLMVLVIKDITVKEKKMELEFRYGKMEANTQVIGQKMASKDMEYISGQMEEYF